MAMVTDDPEHKKNVKAGLAGAFDDAAISEYSLHTDTSFMYRSLFTSSLYVNIQCFNAYVASENGSGQSNGVNGVMTNGDHAGTVLDIPLDYVLNRYPSTNSRVFEKGIHYIIGLGVTLYFVVFCPFYSSSTFRSFSLGQYRFKLAFLKSGSSISSGTQVTENPDGSISIGGRALPPGTVVETNSDGSVSVKGIVLDIPLG